MTRLDTLLLVMAVVVLAMGIVVTVMMWQSRRRREERQLDASAHTVSRLISRRIRLSQLLGSGLL